jgi:hypothetical protein
VAVSSISAVLPFGGGRLGQCVFEGALRGAGLRPCARLGGALRCLRGRGCPLTLEGPRNASDLDEMMDAGAGGRGAEGGVRGGYRATWVRMDCTVLYRTARGGRGCTRVAGAVQAG